MNLLDPHDLPVPAGYAALCERYGLALPLQGV